MNRITFKNWHFSRWIALLAGGFFSWQALYYWEAVPAVLGIFLLYQAVTRSGCLGFGSCEIDRTIQQEKGEDETEPKVKNFEYTKIEEN